MKICFVLHRNFAYIGHALALTLKEKYGFADFCGYSSIRSSYNFLKEQTDINYTSLLLDEDLHEKYKTEKLDPDYLRRLEKDYGIPNLWPYINIDRTIRSNQLLREYPYNTPKYSEEEMLRILQVKSKAIIEFLDKERPDFIFICWIGSMGSSLLYHIAKKRGVKILIMMPLGIRNIHAISEDYRHFTGIEKIFAENKANPGKQSPEKEHAKKYLEDFRKKPEGYYGVAHPKNQSISRFKQFKFLLPANLYKSLRFFITYLYESRFGTDSRDYSYIKISYWLKDRLKRKIRVLIGVNDLFDEVSSADKFVFYALHNEPDISLLLLSPFIDNQSYVIEKISRSLPVGYKLYVKEHPIMVGYRPRSYYKELKKIPNVRLISPIVPSFDLIQKSELVTTISGNVGLEAIFLKKPVVAFADTYYTNLSSVKKCLTLENLPDIIKNQLENFHHNEEELLNFISAIFEDSAETDLYHFWEEETDFAKRKKGLEPLADLLAKKINNFKK